MTGKPDEQRCPICRKIAHAYCTKGSASYFRCRACGTVYQQPLPTVQEMMSYADREYSGGVYKQYVQARDLKYATFRRRTAALRKMAGGTRLLDVGSSCGYFIDMALQEGFDAHGVEFSATAIAAASPEARARIVQGDVNQLGHAQRNSYDVVTAFDIIEHTLDPISFLSQISVMLKDDGLLAITTPDTGHPLRTLMGARWPMLQPFQHTVLFSRPSLQMALTRAGYAEAEMSTATKVLTADYLVHQVEPYTPSIVHAYAWLAKAIPSGLRHRPVTVRIGEVMALARLKPLGDGPSAPSGGAPA